MKEQKDMHCECEHFRAQENLTKDDSYYCLIKMIKGKSDFKPVNPKGKACKNDFKRSF